jgi:hypothetical protein
MRIIVILLLVYAVLKLLQRRSAPKTSAGRDFKVNTPVPKTSIKDDAGEVVSFEEVKD